ncbi:MAG: tetratricopeptide repeat protein [Terracidiphilus sp.]
MGTARKAGWEWVLLASSLALPGASHAACTGPDALVRQLRAHPGIDNAVLLGSWYANHQHFACAAEIFRAALKTDPKSAQLNYLAGLALIADGKPEEALPVVRQAVQLDPSVIKPHLVLGSLLDQEGKRDEAEQQWRLALKIDPKSIPALEGLSDNELAREDYTAVIVLLRNAPRTEKLSINLSKALGKLNYLEDAAKVLTEAMQQSPQSFDLVRAMTVVLVNMHHYEEAVKLLQNASDQRPGDIDAQVELFRILVLTSHFDRASKIAPVLLPLRPHDYEVLYLCGAVAHAMGENEKARDLLDQSVKINPDFFYSRYYFGIVLVLLREWQAAKENLEKAIELDVPLAEVHFELAKALKGLGETGRATQELELYQKLKKDEESGLEAASSSAQGDHDLADGKLDEAMREYREALAEEPSNAGYKFKLSIVLGKSGDEAGERAQLEDAVRLDPRLAGAQNRLGFVLSRAGDADGAVAHFRLAVKAAPAWPQAWINLAAELAVTAHFSEARQAVNRALELDPNNAQAQQLSDRLARDPAAAQEYP